MVVRRAAADGRSGSGGLGLDPRSVHVIPFPVNEPELWPAYVPDGVTQYIRLFSGWGETKNERLRAGLRGGRARRGAEKESRAPTFGR